MLLSLQTYMRRINLVQTVHNSDFFEKNLRKAEKGIDKLKIILYN